MVGPDSLLHASDHPHRHQPGGERLPELLREAELSGNAEAFYRLGAGVA